MSYTHLTTFERAKIETLHTLNYSTRAIANEIGRNHTTVSRELKRHIQSDEIYQSEKAQSSYEERRTNCGCHGIWTKEVAEQIEQKLEETWSPEQISNRLFKGEVSFKTIYRWLYLGLLKVTINVLRQKGKRQKPKEKRGRFNVGTSITKRPAEVKGRNTFGHWELDTVVSGRGDSKGCVTTFIERKTSWYTAIKMPNRSAQSMEIAIRTLQNKLPEGSILTGTSDRGKEFSCYQVIEKELEIEMFFAEPYSSWQRGSNENGNGLLREFFPKKQIF
jgi:IS30 family transposase